jgi:gas vesicle protein
MDEKRIISEFTKLLTHLSENTEKTSEGIQSLLALSGSQLKALKDLASSTANFTAEVTDAIFDSQEAEEEFNQKILDKEEELSELSDDEIEKMANVMQDGLDGVKDAVEEIVEQNETKAKKDKKNKQKTDKRESERVDHFENASHNLSKTAQFLSKESGINKIFTFIPDLMDSFKSEFSGIISAFDTLLISPLKGFGSMFMGVDNMLFSPLKSLFSTGDSDLTKTMESQKEKQQEEETNDAMIAILAEIEKNTSPEDEMIKGRDLDLKKLIPDFKMPAMGIGGKMGGMLWKLAGAGMIIGGIYMAVQDFMDGFSKGGLGEGLYQAFVGKTDQGIMGSLKNAGKWALIGAGIGTFIAPVVGTIAGGILGGAIGFAINSVAQIFEGTGSVGSKIGETIFGKGSGGIMESVKAGGRWALLGAGIGTYLAPGVGTIAGGIIGFAVGFLINFVHQILDPSIVSGLTTMFTTIGGWIGDAWTWLAEGTTSLLTSIWEGLKTTWNWVKEKVIIAWTLYTLPYKYLWEGFEWLAEKLGIKPYIDAFKTKVSKMWTAVKDTFGQLIDWITNIGTNLWDSFKTVIGDYWKRIKQWVGASDEDESDPLPTGATPTKRVVKKEQQNEKKVENRAETILDSGIKTSDAVSSVAEVTEATKEDIVKGNSTTKDISKILKDMTTFFKNDFLKKIESYFDKSSTYLADTLFNIQQEDRMWSYQTTNGSLAGYGSRVKEFSGEIAKLEKGGKEGYETKLKDIRQNSIDNSTSIITNNSIIDGYSDSLRKKKQRN